MPPAIAAIIKIDVRNTLTDDFLNRFHTTQFPPILAIIGRLVTPEKRAFFPRVASLFWPVTGVTNVARKSQGKGIKFF
jgi:hypothetical protein